MSSNQTAGSPRSLEDTEIVTERKLSRRSFVASAGALLAGGAVAIVAEGRTHALQVTPNDPNYQPPNDPNRQPPNDPNYQQRNDPNQQRTDPGSQSDPHKRKRRKHKHSDDPDKQQGNEPDSAPPPPSHPDSSML